MTPLRVFTFCLTSLALAVTAALPASANDAADKALRAKAYATCRKPEYRQDTKIVINYAKGWFRCDPPKHYKNNGKRS